jgi:chromosome segregation ATPase
METEILTNQDVTTQNAGITVDPKTFTQDDVNRIVAKRVAKYEDYETLKEKAAKYDEQVEASKSELQKATERADSLQAELDALKSANQIRAMRDEVANTKGIPSTLLTGSTQEECESQADAILAWAQKPTGYPKVPDGGDPISSKSAAEQFADWFNSQV